MTEPRYLAIRIPRGKTLAIICAAIAALLVLGLIPFLTTTMTVPGGNCGTIFASSETWTYNSFSDAASTAAGRNVRSPADLDNYADDLVDIMMSDLNFGSAVYDHCKQRHSTRLIWIITFVVPIVLIGGASVFLFIKDWRNGRNGPPKSDRSNPQRS